MICRLLRHIFLTVILAAGLTACMQGMPSDPASNTTTYVATPHKSTYTHSGYHAYGSTHKASSAHGVSLATNPTDPPPDFMQMQGTGGSLWDRLRTNFQLPLAANRPQVQAQINWFVRNQGYLDRTIKRAVPYMYLIFQETQSRNLPAELVLLPIMESGYNPFIRSSRGAVGLWQLIPSTANGFGVKQDFWYDGRRDVYASTNAALDYLTYLQSYFGGDWLLAIAAYDAGEGRLQNAVHRNAEKGASTDFWSLSLPVETQAYVPRLLALAAIISDPAKYNITLPPITDQPYLQQVDLGAPINLSEAAEMAGMSLNELKSLNPGYSRTTTGPNGPYRLLLPIDRIPMFKERLVAMPAQTKTTWGRYKVQRDDTLDSIAERFDTSASELRSVNHLKGNYVPVGRVIMIPVGTEQTTPHVYDLSTGQKTPLTADNVVQQAASIAESQTPTIPAASPSAPSIAPSNNNQVTVTATSAARTDNTPPPASASAVADNEDADAEQSQDSVQKTPEKVYHTIKHGETLSVIARHYGVGVSDLRRWNKLKASNVLKPGTRLIIYRASTSADSESAASASADNTAKKEIKQKSNSIKLTSHASAVGKSSDLKVIRYTIHPGDNLIKIADHYDVKVASLRKWNRLAENGVVKPGQKIVIYTEG